MRPNKTFEWDNVMSNLMHDFDKTVFDSCDSFDYSKCDNAKSDKTILPVISLSFVPFLKN